MLEQVIENYIIANANGNTIQTTCRPPHTLSEYAAAFTRDSAKGFGYSRSKDGLTQIDTKINTLVSRIPSTGVTNHGLITSVSKSLIIDLYKWATGTNPLDGTAISTVADGRRRTAVIAFLGGAYVNFKHSIEAFNSGPRALAHMSDKVDIPFNLYNYRFGRSGFNLHNAPARLYRGDTRPPGMLWESGGFYPKMDDGAQHDPHLGSGASQQVISSTTDDALVTRFAWHNSLYCPKRFYYIHRGRQDKAIAGFVYEVDKSGQQCIEVTGVTPGREVSFLAIPNRNIRRFKMRYYAGSQSNIVASDWMYYNEAALQNINIEENRRDWEQMKRDYHSTH
jgi:hypothetical protein